MADLVKIGIDDVVASATEGVLRAMAARKVRVDGLEFKDLVASGYIVDLIIRAGGFPFPVDIGPGGPGGGIMRGGGR